MGTVPIQTLLICYYRKKSHKISQPRNSSYVHILSNVTIEMISIGNVMQYLMNLEFKSSFWDFGIQLYLKLLNLCKKMWTILWLAKLETGTWSLPMWKLSSETRSWMNSEEEQPSSVEGGYFRARWCRKDNSLNNPRKIREILIDSEQATFH